jgi:uncharacterized membrane protein YkvA (DUF1232 family)
VRSKGTFSAFLLGAALSAWVPSTCRAWQGIASTACCAAAEDSAAGRTSVSRLMSNTRVRWAEVGGAHVARACRSGVISVPCSFWSPLRLVALRDSLRPNGFEQQLSGGSDRLAKTVRQMSRRIFKVLAWSATQWVEWTTRAVVFIVFGLGAALIDRTLVRTWRERGFGAVRLSLLLALAVYIRLLFDRRAPMIGKGLLAFAIVYGVAPGDLVPDYLVPLGFADDLVAVALAARCFMRLCPDRLVEAHAARAAQARDRILRWRPLRRKLACSK